MVLEFLFPYGFKYEMGPPMSEKQVKESRVTCRAPYFHPGGGRGVIDHVFDKMISDLDMFGLSMILQILSIS